VLRRLGTGMTIAAWVSALALLTLLFSGLLDRQENPNRNVQTLVGPEGVKEVVLKRNRAGHYVADGRINGQPVTFLLDTGATDVAIPEAVARRSGLERGRRRLSRTAAGDVMTWSTLLRSVDLGGIKLYTIPATILPDLAGEQVLLGMSYLKRLELVQRGDTLTLRYP
jgi:aspartyl protease family protein